MTAALASTVAAPPVRLRPVPATEPAYERERSWPEDPVGPHDVELPLDWGLPDRSVGRTAARSRGSSSGQRGGSQPGPSGWRVMAEDLRLVVKRFVDMYVEVLNERRPIRHLLPHASEEVIETVQQSLMSRGRGWWPATRGKRRRDRPVSHLRPQPMPIRVQRLRFSVPRPDVVEVAAVLRRGDEVRAVALRLEREHHHWRCTVLDFVG